MALEEPSRMKLHKEQHWITLVYQGKFNGLHL